MRFGDLLEFRKDIFFDGAVQIAVVDALELHRDVQALNDALCAAVAGHTSYHNVLQNLKMNLCIPYYYKGERRISQDFCEFF